ncbi:MAG: DNA polymerase III subunit beta [Actinomycetota bacterium]
MKFEIGKDQLLDALKAVGPAVAPRSCLPVLSGVRLEAAAGRVDLQTTDLETSIRLQVRASTPQDGAVTRVVVAPAKALTKAVAGIRGDVLRIETSEDQAKPRLRISCSQGRSISLECYAADDWPAIGTDVSWQRLASFESADLAQALARVALCASADEARPVLTGVQFNLGQDAAIAELVATDSYRLGVVRVRAEFSGSTETPKPLVPARAMKELAKQLTGRKGLVDVYVGAAEGTGGSFSCAEFVFGERSWVVREIGGAFPDWQRLLPVKETGSLDYDAKEMADAIKAAASLRSAKTVPLRIDVGEVCTVRLVEDGVAVVTESLRNAIYSPNGTGTLDLAFKADWLGDAVRFVGGKRQRVWVEDRVKPALFFSPETQDCSYLLMPVRLS